LPEQLDHRAHLRMCWIVQLDELTSFRERNISIVWCCRVWQHWSRDQERYCSKSSTLTVCSDCPSGRSLHAWVSIRLLTPEVRWLANQRPCSFRVRSSAKRAFGGCLGSKRR
jgi:hypothetical protein